MHQWQSVITEQIISFLNKTLSLELDRQGLKSQECISGHAPVKGCLLSRKHMELGRLSTDPELSLFHSWTQMRFFTLDQSVGYQTTEVFVFLDFVCTDLATSDRYLSAFLSYIFGCESSLWQLSHLSSPQLFFLTIISQIIKPNKYLGNTTLYYVL